jgi:Protein of unknown function (DUF3501)
VSALRPDELLPNDQFLAQRKRLETLVLEAKHLRRVGLGPAMTLLFENRQTLLWQVQEMCRVEGIVAPAAIAHELDTYGAMLPDAETLSATLLIDVADPAERDRRVVELVGLQHHVRLQFADGSSAPATFDAEQFDGRRISAVQFLRVPLTGNQIDQLGQLSAAVHVVVDHPRYRVDHPLSGPTRAALYDDLSQS